MWCATKKITIDDLRQSLQTAQQNHKSDDDVANLLKTVELREQLTRAAADSLAPLIPGPLSTEQIYILRGRSAFLSPPPSDLPSAAAPDLAAQKALLAKAIDYVTRSYMQNPRLSAAKTTSRFQDGVESIRTNSGMTNNVPNVDPLWANPNQFMRLLGTHTVTAESEHGVEIIPQVKQQEPWGQNGQISEGGPGPVLSIVLQQAADAGKLQWLRWETVNGKQVAVFSFAVDKKKGHYEVHYCCFPITEDAGRMGYEGTGANFQTASTWKDFRTTVGYHGEFFIDPDSGVIVRLITQAELKPTDFVHQEDMRIDYGPVAIDGRTYIVPLENITLNEVVPNGDNYAARYSVRHTLFEVSYKDYQAAPAGK